MYRAALAAILAAAPAFAQVRIAENGIQIAAPGDGFSLYDDDEFFKARPWLGDCRG